eukprot:tig00020904_g15200.t1
MGPKRRGASAGGSQAGSQSSRGSQSAWSGTERSNAFGELREALGHARDLIFGVSLIVGKDTHRAPRWFAADTVIQYLCVIFLPLSCFGYGSWEGDLAGDASAGAAFRRNLVRYTKFDGVKMKDFEAVWAVTVALVVAAFANMCYLGYAFKTHRFRFKFPLRYTRIAGHFLPSAAYIPVLVILLEPLDCPSGIWSAASAPHASFPADWTCWSGKHMLYAAISVVALLLFASQVLLYALFFYESKPGQRHAFTARVHSREQLVYLAAMAFGCVFLSISSIPRMWTGLVGLACGIACVYSVLKYFPYYELRLNQLRAAALSAYTWVSLLVFVEGRYAERLVAGGASPGAFIAACVVGIAASFAGGWFLSRLFFERRLCTGRVFGLGLSSAWHAEVGTRFLHRDASPPSVLVAEQIYQRALALHPHSAAVRLCYGQFLLRHSENTQSGYRSYEEAGKRGPFLDVEFQVFQAAQERILASQGAGAAQAKRGKHVNESEELIAHLEFQKDIAGARSHHKAAFNEEVLNDPAAAQDLYDAADEYEETNKQEYKSGVKNLDDEVDEDEDADRPENPSLRPARHDRDRDELASTDRAAAIRFALAPPARPEAAPAPGGPEAAESGAVEQPQRAAPTIAVAHHDDDANDAGAHAFADNGGSSSDVDSHRPLSEMRMSDAGGSEVDPRLVVELEGRRASQMSMATDAAAAAVMIRRSSQMSADVDLQRRASQLSAAGADSRRASQTSATHGQRPGDKKTRNIQTWLAASGGEEKGVKRGSIAEDPESGAPSAAFKPAPAAKPLNQPVDGGDAFLTLPESSDPHEEGGADAGAAGAHRGHKPKKLQIGSSSSVGAGAGKPSKIGFAKLQDRERGKSGKGEGEGDAGSVSNNGADADDDDEDEDPKARLKRARARGGSDGGSAAGSGDGGSPRRPGSGGDRDVEKERQRARWERKLGKLKRRLALSAGQGTHQSIDRMKKTVAVVIVVLIALAGVCYGLMSSLMDTYKVGISRTGLAGLRRLQAVNVPLFSGLLVLSGLPEWDPKSTMEAYARKQLLGAVNKLEEVHFGLRTVLSEENVAVNYVIRDNGATRDRPISEWDLAFQLIDAGREMLKVKPGEFRAKYPDFHFNPHLHFLYENGPEEAYNQFVKSNDDENKVTLAAFGSIRVFVICMVCAATAACVLLAVFFFRPKIKAVQTEKEEAIKLFFDIPKSVLRRIAKAGREHAGRADEEDADEDEEFDMDFEKDMKKVVNGKIAAAAAAGAEGAVGGAESAEVHKARRLERVFGRNRRRLDNLTVTYLVAFTAIFAVFFAWFLIAYTSSETCMYFAGERSLGGMRRSLAWQVYFRSTKLIADHAGAFGARYTDPKVLAENREKLLSVIDWLEKDTRDLTYGSSTRPDTSNTKGQAGRYHPLDVALFGIPCTEDRKGCNPYPGTPAANGLNRLVSEYITKARMLARSSPEFLKPSNPIYQFLKASTEGPMTKMNQNAIDLSIVESDFILAQFMKSQQMMLGIVCATVIFVYLTAFRSIISRVQEDARRTISLLLMIPSDVIESVASIRECLVRKAAAAVGAGEREM